MSTPEAEEESQETVGEVFQHDPIMRRSRPSSVQPEGTSSRKTAEIERTPRGDGEEEKARNRPGREIP